MKLSEKYRPRGYAGVVGQDRAIKTLSALAPGGRAFWITGKSGTGKTTMARILAESVAGRFDTTEIVGRQLTVTELRALTDRWNYYPMDPKGGYALVVNEAHGMSRPTIEVLLDVLENLKPNVTVIFTTTHDGEAGLFEDHIDAGPLTSRCFCLRLTDQGLSKAFAKRLQEIAKAEHLDGKPIGQYVELVNQCRANMRECLNRIEAGEMLI